MTLPDHSERDRSSFPAATHSFFLFYTTFRTGQRELLLYAKSCWPYDRFTFAGDVCSNMPMRETVRSGRKENFYITDNSFIDYYAREMQPTDIAVYQVLERYANCHTRSTWVGTAKIAEVLNISQRTVQRSLKVLENLKLIRIVRTATLTTYYVDPVRPRTKRGATPLFDAIEDEVLAETDDASVAWATPASQAPTPMSHQPSSVSREATSASRASDIGAVLYKEEQNLLNKTNEQDLFDKIHNPGKLEIGKSARRIVKILRLPDTSINAAAAAVEETKKRTRLSTDGIVQEIVTAANHAQRRGIESSEFLEDFLTEKSARQILGDLALPDTNNLVSTVTASLKAEVKYTGFPVEKAAELITSAAIEDRRRGVAIDRFYFEGVKWRSNGRVSKAEQRKLDNLEVNARVKQRLRERLGVS
jgi:predicted transcriptional regulator